MAKPSEIDAERLSAVMDHVADGIITFDADGFILSANPAACAIFDYAPDALVGLSLEQLMSDRKQAHPTNFAQLNLKSHQTDLAYIRNEAVGRRQQGQTFYLDFSISRMFQGESPTFVGIVRDVTDQKRRERELRQAKATAERSSQSKTNFLASMSQEIRTPLDAMLGMTRLLQDTSLTPEQRALTNTLWQSGDLLLQIINDILDFSNIETGKLVLAEQPYGPRECLEAALEMFADQAAVKELELVGFVHEAVPTQVVGDAARLSQVLINLVSNAVKFTQSGEVVASVELLGEKNGRYHLRFSVKDSGIGIPPANMERLFQPFSQLTTAETRRHGGTGLGLAISKHLVEYMGGRIQAESEPGKGSRFTFTILAGQSASPPPPPYLQAEQPLLNGKTILLGLTNKTTTSILARQVKLWGMVPTICNSPAELEHGLAQARPVDVALLDGQLAATAYGSLLAHRGTDAEIPILLTTRQTQSRPFPQEEMPVRGNLTRPFKTAVFYQSLIELFRPKTISKPTQVETLGEILARSHALADEQPTAITDAWPINRAFIDKTLGLDANDLLDDLLPLFLEDAPRLLQQIEDGIATKQQTAVRQAAHTLKGSSGTMGMLTIAEQCAALEAQSSAGDFTSLPLTFSRLKAEYRRVAVALAATT